MNPDPETVGRPPSPTLGVVAISYNEERDLPYFLAHLLPWVDEIIIVDDGSTDKTAELAQAAGDKVKFISSPRKAGEYYSHQRNKGIDAASSDWLLHMDIDERVTPELAQAIIDAIRRPDFDAYRYRRVNYFLHRPMRGGGWQNWNQVHLARRNLFRFGGKFHESCEVDATPDRIGQLSPFMHHLNDESYSERLRKSNTYLEEIADSIEKKFQAKGREISWVGISSLTLRDFVYRYFYRFGFRDGSLGLLSALHSASAVMRAAILVWDRQHLISRQDLEQSLRGRWNPGPSQSRDDDSPSASRGEATK